MNKTLYSLTEEHFHILKEVEEVEIITEHHGEEIAEEIKKDLQQRLAINEEERDFKALAYLEVISQRESENKMISEEIKRLQALKKRNERLVDRLKENLVSAVKIFGNFNVGTHSFKIRKSEAVVVNNLEDLRLYDESLVEVITTHKPDKRAIKEAIKAGESVEGAHIEIRESLNVK